MKLNTKITRILPLLATVALSCTLQGQPKAYSKNPEINQKVDSLLQLMTLKEKIGQMNQYNGFWDVTGPGPTNGNAKVKYDHLKEGLVGSMLNVKGVAQVRAVQKIAVEETRLGIPLIIGFDVIHGYKTLNPIPLAEAASWDLEAIKTSASVAAAEAAAAGINWTFAPMVDISRDPRWGRVMEGAGEDPFLGSKIAKARVEGFQGDDLSAPNTIAACAKHFAAYGFSEAGKEYNTVDIGSSTLYNMVLPPFKAASESGVKTMMNSFNELNGVPATGNSFLLRDLLKGKWGFKGFVVSDWASIKEMVTWGYAKHKKDASRLAAIAGCDLDMESNAYVNELESLVKEGAVKEALIDEAARRILTVKYELGLFKDPYRYCDEEREETVINSKAHHASALEMAKKSIVLLKNDTQLLPLKKKGQTIALIGGLAADNNSPLGSWRLASKDSTAVSVLKGMTSYKGNKLIYAKGADVNTSETEFTIHIKLNTNDKSGFDEAIAAAKKADVVVMVLGEHGFQSGEGRSRTELGLPGVQQELLEAVYAVNKKIVLVLNNGRPLTINWADQHIPSIVEAWQLGSQAGNAIAQVLYGDYNPSGKLPMTFPRNVGQIPIYYNYKNTGRPINEQSDKPNFVFWSHYSDVENTPLYPFGYGLSYTTFTYKNIKLSKSKYNRNETVSVSFDISNTGKLKGKELTQLYIRDLHASVTRHIKELKGFQHIELNPGETKTVTFTLTKAQLGFYNNVGDFVLEPGTFEVFIGGSSYTSLKTSFDLN